MNFLLSSPQSKQISLSYQVTSLFINLTRKTKHELNKKFLHVNRYVFSIPFLYYLLWTKSLNNSEFYGIFFIFSVSLFIRAGFSISFTEILIFTLYWLFSPWKTMQIRTQKSVTDMFVSNVMENKTTQLKDVVSYWFYPLSIFQ